MQHSQPGTPRTGNPPEVRRHATLPTHRSIVPPNEGDPAPWRSPQPRVLRIHAHPTSIPQDVEWNTGVPQPFRVSPVTFATKVEIYLGMGLDDDSTVSPSTWDKFVRDVVAVAFAAGSFTVGGVGVYRGASEPSRKIEAVVEGDPLPGVESVASEWLTRAHQAEVFVILTPLHGGPL